MKTAEDENVEGIPFTITGNGINQTVTMGANGEIQIDHLTPGTYTVTEQFSDFYETPESQCVTVVSGQTAAVTFNNVLKQGSLKVTKTSEDGLVEGLTVALSQVGNVGGEIYWRWYGFDSKVNWCACFVAWCADQCGYIDAGVIPKFAACVDGAAWFQERGLWQDRSYVPRTGDIIFFDKQHVGETRHVGIVERVEGDVIYAVEGNSSDQCRQRSYPVGSDKICGFGVPAY